MECRVCLILHLPIVLPRHTQIKTFSDTIRTKLHSIYRNSISSIDRNIELMIVLYMLAVYIG